jgi:hypothetical protein
MASVFKVYTYTSDTTGLTFPVKMLAVDGDAINTGGVVGTTPIHVTRSKLRKVDGVCLTTNPPKRRRIICCSPANAKWTAANPGTFTIGADTYTIVGRVGEKRF